MNCMHLCAGGGLHCPCHVIPQEALGQDLFDQLHREDVDDMPGGETES
jgi:hypothetical protein